MSFKKVILIPITFLAILTLSAGIDLVVKMKTLGHLSSHYVKTSINSDGMKAKYELTKRIPEDWYPLERISKYTQDAIVISEDWAFEQHRGVDFNQLRRVFTDFLKTGRFSRGASTITQQLVKNLILQKDHKYLRKLREWPLSLYLETKTSKKKILETYLNMIEYGPGVFGVANASHYYFQKSPDQLNLKESVYLAVMLPSPKRYSQSFLKREVSPFITKTMEELLQKMKVAKKISQGEYEGALQLRLSFEEVDANEFGEELSNEDGEEGVYETSQNDMDLWEEWP